MTWAPGPVTGSRTSGLRAGLGAAARRLGLPSRSLLVPHEGPGPDVHVPSAAPEHPAEGCGFGLLVCLAWRFLPFLRPGSWQPCVHHVAGPEFTSHSSSASPGRAASLKASEDAGGAGCRGAPGAPGRLLGPPSLRPQYTAVRGASPASCLKMYMFNHRHWFLPEKSLANEPLSYSDWWGLFLVWP